MVYDTARSRFVAVSGPRTLEWDGSAWQTRATPRPAPARYWSGLAYDNLRRRTLLFGGFESSSGAPVATNELWEYDGLDWSLRPAAGPSARTGHAMAFDSARGRLCVFGGDNRIADTWEWDGSSWTQATPPVSPSPRVFATMAFHAATGAMILFGGALWAPPYASNETWSWDGAAWTLLSPGVGPPARNTTRMSANDAAGVVVMHGGMNTNGLLDDTWEWNGNTWINTTGATQPRIRSMFGMATDTAGVTLLLGGTFSFWHPGLRLEQESLGDTWAYIGSGGPWVQVSPTGPPYRSKPCLEYDSVRDRLVLAGGSTGTIFSTWDWDGANWTRLYPPFELPTIADSAVSYDRARGVVVVYGGFAASPAGLGYVDWTHEWNGSTWSRINVPGPPARIGHAMAFDRARAVVVMFGGAMAGSPLGDTWTFDGTVWTQVANAGPLNRSMHAMAYDSARARVVLFGGQDSRSRPMNDTWEWNGTAWTNANPAVAPSPRISPALAYDPVRMRTVAVGGIGQVGSAISRPLREAWEWDGVQWTGGPRDVPVDPDGTAGGLVLVYHDRLQRMVLMTNVVSASLGISSDLWIGDPDAASVEVAGTGCGGATVPRLLPFGPPTVGNVSFGLDLLGVPASAVALLGVSSASGNVPLGAGCTFHLSGTAVTVAVPANANGFAAMRVPIPAGASFLGFDVFFQAAAVDPAAPLGFALTPFVHASIGL